MPLDGLALIPRYRDCEAHWLPADQSAGTPPADTGANLTIPPAGRSREEQTTPAGGSREEQTTPSAE